ncbi:MAG: hypothetical protein IT456_11435 [Planctomycetes bacterium]|nr:hypothetical protein [Planctomycetota bacterium]
MDSIGSDQVQILNFIAQQAKRIADSLESISVAMAEIREEGLCVVVADSDDSIQSRIEAIGEAIENAVTRLE